MANHPFKTPAEDPDAWDGYDCRDLGPNTAFTDSGIAEVKRMMGNAPKPSPLEKVTDGK